MSLLGKITLTKALIGFGAAALLTKKTGGSTSDQLYYKNQVALWLAVAADDQIIANISNIDLAIKTVMADVDSIVAVKTHESTAAWTLTVTDKYNIIAAMLKSYKFNMPMAWQFTSQHQAIQARIDRCLGSDFRNTVTPFVFARETWAPLINQVAGARDINELFHHYKLPNITEQVGMAFQQTLNRLLNDTDFQNSLTQGYAPRGAIITLPSLIENGTMGVSWLSFATADDAMQGIYNACTNSALFVPNSIPLAGDTYKSYSYPTPSVAALYGSNLSYFVRANPNAFTLFGTSITVSSALMIIGAIVATITTVGAAGAVTIPALISGIAAIASKIPSLKNIGSDVAKATDTASQLVNIANGASITTTGGSNAQMIQQAQDFVDNNPDIFSQIS